MIYGYLPTPEELPINYADTLPLNLKNIFKLFSEKQKNICSKIHCGKEQGEHITFPLTFKNSLPNDLMNYFRVFLLGPQGRKKLGSNEIKEYEAISRL